MRLPEESILILSVNDEGLVSLWDDKESRESGAAEEFHVEITLTEEQLKNLTNPKMLIEQVLYGNRQTNRKARLSRGPNRWGVELWEVGKSGTVYRTVKTQRAAETLCASWCDNGVVPEGIE